MNRIGDLSVPRVAALYSRVSADRMGKFQAFLRDFPYKELSFEGLSWPYFDNGRGDPPLLILSGALTIPDISWTSITGFAERHRVIVPAYPPVGTMDALADGIAAILRREGIGQVHVMGGSYGGFVAQAFVRKFPGMVLSLVLSHTQPPYLEGVKRMKGVSRIMRLMPMGLIRPMVRKTFKSMMPERSEDTECLLAIYEELIGFALSKPDILGIIDRMADFSARSFSPRDLAEWPGKVLLVFGENDPASPPEVRERMESLYPGCAVRLFEGSGHTTSVTRADEYQKTIEDFLWKG